MATFQYSEDLGNYVYPTATILQTMFDEIKNFLNGGIENDNINGSAEIDPGKIAQGGCLTALETSDTGEEGRVPVYNSTGGIAVQGLTFKTGIS